VSTRLGSLRSRSPLPGVRAVRDGRDPSPDNLKRSSRSDSSNDSGSIKSSNLSIGSSAVATSSVVYDVPENAYNNQVTAVTFVGFFGLVLKITSKKLQVKNYK
jgi:hypothetical protein